MFRSAALAEEASRDIDDATSWYENQSGAALANPFLDDVWNAIDRIEILRCLHRHRDPRLWRPPAT